MATDNQTLTDALNATLVTYNGNEMMLQNDMGNTKIQDSKTGNIMGLSEGFIPVGMKEHGGIMYIASVNKEGKGEIGTIPSPIYTLQHKHLIPDNWIQVLADENGPNTNPSMLNNYKLYPGDKFVIHLPLEYENNLSFSYFANGESNPSTATKTLLSYFDDENTKIPGLYDLSLYSVYSTGYTELSTVTSLPQSYYSKDKELYHSDYWFIPSITGEFDHELMHIGGLLKTYPGNLPPGRLAVRASLEGIKDFQMIRVLQSKQSVQRYTTAPYIYNYKDNKYRLYFLGFLYQVDSSRFISNFKVKVYNQSSLDLLYENEFQPYSYRTGSTEVYAQVSKTKIDDKGVNSIQLRKYYTNTEKYLFYEANNADELLDEDFEHNEKYVLNNSLFSIDIGSNLKEWYRIVVDYFDLYGGSIGTYVYSFNPHHILHYKDSYFNLQWAPYTSIQQYADLEKELECEFPIFDPVKFDGENNNRIGDEQRGLIEGKPRPLTGSGTDDFSHVFKWPELTDDQNPVIDVTLFSTNITKSKDISYIHPVDILNNDITFTGENFDSMYLQIPGYKTDLNALADIQARVFLTIDRDPSYKDVKDILAGLGSGRDMNYYQTGLHYSSFSVKHKKVLIPYKEFSKISYSGQELDYEVQLLLKLPSGYFSVTNPDYVDYTVDENRGEYLAYLDTPLYYEYELKYDDSNPPIINVDGGTYPNKSAYSLIPEFKLLGQKEGEALIQLGLDRNGIATKAWQFGQNFIQSYVNKNNRRTDVKSTFVRNINYINSDGITDSFILRSGVYIVNVQALGQNPQSSPYFQIEDSRSTYKVCTAEDSEGFVYFTPTLLYIPSDTVFSIKWGNISHFTGAGLYQIGKDIIYSNMGAEEKWNSGDQIKVMYYQDYRIKEGTEPILPICATYYENVQNCMNRNYDYYQGPNKPFSISYHVDIERNFRSFIYKYNPGDPCTTTISTVSGAPEQLTYRTLNE